jgi:hypothetical protein
MTGTATECLQSATDCSHSQPLSNPTLLDGFAAAGVFSNLERSRFEETPWSFQGFGEVSVKWLRIVLTSSRSASHAST